ncbi:MAG: acyltransferase [Candidatus Competibacteraceae bacterium]|nr:acyltransferase [Candidatus Competibacteraceae bacterium]
MAYAPELDGLRGIAILAVMLFHTEMSIFKGGFIGVDIFFVLSGFLITSLLIQEFVATKTISLKNFYIRRLLRLGPALMLLLISYCIISFFFLSKEQANSNYIDAFISLIYLSNWARAFDVHPPDFLGHTWSLSIEEQFYILWPILLLTLLRISKNRWYVFIFTVLIALVSWLLRIHFIINDVSLIRVYNGLDTRADALMTGCALGVLLVLYPPSEMSRHSCFKWLKYLSPLAMLCLLFLVFASDWQDFRMYYFGFSVVECLVFILILDIRLNKEGILSKLLALKGLVWIGSISYGLYLWHYPVYRTMFALGFGHKAVVFVGTLATFIIAMFSYFILEKPVLRLRKFFSYKSLDQNNTQMSTQLPSGQTEILKM